MLLMYVAVFKYNKRCASLLSKLRFFIPSWLVLESRYDVFLPGWKVYQMIVKLVSKSMNMFLMFGKKIEMKTMKDCQNLHLKCDILLLADVFEKFRKISLKINGLCLGHFVRSKWGCNA